VVSGNNESMTSTVVVFLVVATIFSVGDWWAVQVAKKSLEYLCKPLATVAFLGAAIAIFNADGVSQTWRVIALVFCLLGDVFLMLPRDAFVPGLASFAVAQICFAVSLFTQDATLTRLVVGLIIVVPTTLFLARRFVKSISTSGTPIDLAVSAFTESGVEAAYFVPSHTYVNKYNIEARNSFREFIRWFGLHDYSTRLQGADSSKIILH